MGAIVPSAGTAGKPLLSEVAGVLTAARSTILITLAFLELVRLSYFERETVLCKRDFSWMLNHLHACCLIQWKLGTVLSA